MSTLSYMTKNQSIIKEIYDSAIQSVQSGDIPKQNWIVTPQHTSVIYMGVKVMKTTLKNGEDFYEIMNVHSSDYYKWSKRSELKVFMENGFQRGAWILAIQRNKKKIDSINRRITTSTDENNVSVTTNLVKKRREYINLIIKLEEKLAV